MRYSCVLCLLACLPADVRARSLPDFEWPRDLNGIPAANATDITTIEGLINGVLAPELAAVRVGAFRFVPLESVNRVDLIASIDSSGRGMFNAFVAVWPSAGTYGHAILPAERQGVLARDVVDLDGTGVHEVIAGTIPGGYQGAATIPITWYSVQALRQGKWIDVSGRYPQVYGDLMPRAFPLLRVTEAGLSGDKEALQLYKACGLFLLYKHERAVLHHSNAGLATALDWAGSSAPSIQILAIETLRDITDPRAVSVLRTLARSQDFGVSFRAKDALAHLGAVDSLK